jgi:hypothetical protein
MKHDPQPSGLRHGLELFIDANWSPEQAMAVIELLDDLRDRIWSRYESVLMEQFRNDRVTWQDIKTTDPPF